MRLLRYRTSGILVVLMCSLSTGCVHQTQTPPLAQQTKTPNIYVPPPEEVKLPPMVEGAPPPDLTNAKPATAAEVKPKKKPKRQPATPVTQTPPVTTPPQATTDVAQTEQAKLGALASGGPVNPQQQQEVAGKIGAVEKRIDGLPAATVEKEQKQIAKVRLFVKEASDALKGGDVEGAAILATKADLLLDDLAK